MFCQSLSLAFVFSIIYLKFIQITIPWIFNDEHNQGNQNLQPWAWNREIFSQQNIYTSYLTSKLWIQRSFKVWNKFHVNLENFQVLFFFLLGPCFLLSRLWWLSWVSADCDQERSHLWQFSFVEFVSNWFFALKEKYQYINISQSQ